MNGMVVPKQTNVYCIEPALDCSRECTFHTTSAWRNDVIRSDGITLVRTKCSNGDASWVRARSSYMVHIQVVAIPSIAWANDPQLAAG